MNGCGLILIEQLILKGGESRLGCSKILVQKAFCTLCKSSVGLQTEDFCSKLTVVQFLKRKWNKKWREKLDSDNS